MSLHDEYARLTPFEIAFPDRAVVERLSSEVARETAGRGLDDSVPESFMTTVAVAELVRELRGADAPPETTYPFAALLFHSVHFLRAECRLYLVDTDATRRITADRSRVEAEALHAPAAAGYLQLPQHLMWTHAAERSAGSESATPESLDGLFWTLTAAGMLHALPISGVRPDRPGFGALPLPPAPLLDAPAWLDAQIREAGDDFASTLPGGELDELYSVQAAGEVLKLLARFFALTGGSGARLEELPPSAEAGDGGPRPSGLPYTRVSVAG